MTAAEDLALPYESTAMTPPIASPSYTPAPTPTSALCAITPSIPFPLPPLPAPSVPVQIPIGDPVAPGQIRVIVASNGVEGEPVTSPMATKGSSGFSNICPNCPRCGKLYTSQSLPTAPHPLSAVTARVLDCGHAFCEACLDSVRVGGQLACPECHAVSTLPENGLVTGLPKNFALNELLEGDIKTKAVFMSRVGSCPICMEVYGNHHIPRVLQCGHTFCDQCLAKCIDPTKKAIACPHKCHTLTRVDSNDPIRGGPPANESLIEVLIRKSSTARFFLTKPARTIPFPFSRLSDGEGDEDRHSPGPSERLEVRPIRYATFSRPSASTLCDSIRECWVAVRRLFRCYCIPRVCPGRPLRCLSGFCCSFGELALVENMCFWPDLLLGLVSLGVAVYAFWLFDKYKNEYCERPLTGWLLASAMYVVVSTVLGCMAFGFGLGGRVRLRPYLIIFTIPAGLVLSGLGLYFAFSIPNTEYACPSALVISSRVISLISAALSGLNAVACMGTIQYTRFLERQDGM